MTIGLNARMIESRYPLPEAFHKAAEFGYGAYEIEIGIDPAPWPERSAWWKERAPDLRAHAREAGLVLPSLCLSVLWQHSLASPEARERDEAIGIVHDCLDLATDLGAAALLLPVGQPRGLDARGARARLIRSVQRCIRGAEAAGVVLALENVCQDVLRTAGDLIEVVDTVGSRACGVYYDPGNQSFLGIDPLPEIAQLGWRIVRLHAKDTIAAMRPGLEAPAVRVTGDFSVWRRRTTVDLGEGELDYRRIAAAVRAIGYEGGVVVEVPQAPETVEPGCRANLRAAAGLFGEGSDAGRT